MKYKFCILANEDIKDIACWIEACEDYSDYIEYDIVNLISSTWLIDIQKNKYDCLLAKPSALTSLYKQLYDERIFIIHNVLKIPVYPSLLEIFLYENKRFLSYWLKANKLEHPETYVFYSSEEAVSYKSFFNYPIVSKSNIGASGAGVMFIYNEKEYLNHIENVFSAKGVKRRWGPNFYKKNLFKRGLNYLFNPKDINEKLFKYNSIRKDIQNGFVILQQYIPHLFEWRVVSIGGSYFAHKKLKFKEKASGSLLKNYDNPPINLLDFVKNIMDKYKFTSQAIDLFQTEEGKYLINEIQCIFGQSDPFQMMVDGDIGRYIFKNENWVFEKGDFNQNESFNLRVEHILNILESERENGY